MPNTQDGSRGFKPVGIEGENGTKIRITVTAMSSSTDSLKIFDNEFLFKKSFTFISLF
jgi:hypothetical protein